MTRKPRTVLVVMVAFKYDYENCPHEAMKIAKATGFACKAAMHSKRQIAYIVQADISAAALMDRIRIAVSAGCVERAWVFTPAPDLVASEVLDPLRDRVAEAWREVHTFNRRIVRMVDPAKRADSQRRRATVDAAQDRDAAISALGNSDYQAQPSGARN